MRPPGDILLIACYELGHQPLSVAWPAAFLERAGYTPAVMDLSVEPFDAEKVTRARIIAIAVPMHTALRLGVIAAKRIRTLNPTAHICFYGLYAALNADELLAEACADTVLAGELEDQLVDLVRRLEAGEPVEPGEARRANAVLSERASPGSPRSPAVSQRVELVKLAFPVPARRALPGDQEVHARSSATAAAISRRTSRPAAAASTTAGTARFRRSTAAASSWCPSRRCSPTSRQQIAAGADPRDLRRSRFPQRSAACAGRGPRAPRRVPARDLRLHGQGRAPAARARST